MDGVSVPVLFKGGPIGGEFHALPYDALRTRYRVPATGGPVYAALSDREVARSIFAPDSISVEVHEYEYMGERLGDHTTHVMRWVSPIPGLERRIRDQRRTIEELEEILRVLQFGPDYNDDAFEDGLGGW